eukprot:31372-Pelagomonas_calceolata.AAC.2
MWLSVERCSALLLSATMWLSVVWCRALLLNLWGGTMLFSACFSVQQGGSVWYGAVLAAQYSNVAQRLLLSLYNAVIWLGACSVRVVVQGKELGTCDVGIAPCTHEHHMFGSCFGCPQRNQSPSSMQNQLA